MKLSKLYSNHPEEFTDISFNAGLNIIVGRIFSPENRSLDCHNLGKTTFGNILNFCLLGGKSGASFLFNHDFFEDYKFFLEIELHNTFITICRSIKEDSKISIKIHKERNQDFRNSSKTIWSHYKVAIARAKEILDGVFDFTVIKDWGYRKAINYSLRSQSDYNDVFKLDRFKGSHKDWKPYIGCLFGFAYKKMLENYDLVDEINKANAELSRIKVEVSDFLDSFDRLEGLILIKEDHIDKVSKELNKFNFATTDFEETKDIVEDIEVKISALNSSRYHIKKEIVKIENSLEKDVVKLNPDELQRLYQESGVIFADQVIKRFQDLIEFNKKISHERNQILREELKELRKEFDCIDTEIIQLNNIRSNSLHFLKEIDSTEKFKTALLKLTDSKAELLNLKNKAEKLKAYNDKKRKLDGIKNKKAQLIDEIEKDINTQTTDPESIYNRIKIQFNSVIEEIISKKALVKTQHNQEGNIDFSIELLDSTGEPTSESDGHSYKKFLCMAFDISINLVFKDEKFPHFIFHDGIFDNMDIRKKLNFIELCNKVAGEGIQYIITFIDSDLPEDENITDYFKSEDYILELDDSGNSGRLFKRPLW